MPKILLSLFRDKPDLKGQNAFETLQIIKKCDHADSVENKPLIYHMIEEIWDEYDRNNNGYLDKEESIKLIHDLL